MLSKKNRFSGPHAVRNLQRHGSSVRSGILSAKFQEPRHSPAETKIAVVVSKKVDKRAVVRNRIRRVIYESFKRQWDQIKHPVELSVGVFSAEIADQKPDEVDTQVLSLLQKAGLVVEK